MSKDLLIEYVTERDDSGRWAIWELRTEPNPVIGRKLLLQVPSGPCNMLARVTGQPSDRIDTGLLKAFRKALPRKPWRLSEDTIRNWVEEYRKRGPNAVLPEKIDRSLRQPAKA